MTVLTTLMVDVAFPKKISNETREEVKELPNIGVKLSKMVIAL